MQHDAAAPQVDVPGVGPISLLTLDRLRDALRTEQASADRMTRESTQVAHALEDRLADIGALLVPRRAWWRCRPQLAPWLDEAERLVDGIAFLDAEIERLSQQRQSPATAILGAIRGMGRLEQLQQTRVRSAVELRRILIMIANQAGEDGAAVPDVGPLLAETSDLEAYGDQLHAGLSAALPRLGTLSRELTLRTEAWRRLGFDSLYLAAVLTHSPPPPLRCPIDLEPGELVYISTEAGLSRMDAPAPRAGARIGVEHSGIRHWVGRLHDRPAAPTSLVRRDNGTLVVSSHRLAFVGPRESFEVAIGKIVDMDAYLDGIAVAQLASGIPDFFAVKAPRQIAFYLNWAMSAAGV